MYYDEMCTTDWRWILDRLQIDGMNNCWVQQTPQLSTFLLHRTDEGLGYRSFHFFLFEASGAAQGVE